MTPSWWKYWRLGVGLCCVTGFPGSSFQPIIDVAGDAIMLFIAVARSLINEDFWGLIAFAAHCPWVLASCCIFSPVLLMMIAVTVLCRWAQPSQSQHTSDSAWPWSLVTDGGESAKVRRGGWGVEMMWSNALLLLIKPDNRAEARAPVSSEYRLTFPHSRRW